MVFNSKDPQTAEHLRKKRSALCDLIDRFTLDRRLDFPDFNWEKKVGNNFIGAKFGLEMINFVHMHFCKFTFDNLSGIFWPTKVNSTI